jgi:hypothetical protein
MTTLPYYAEIYLAGLGWVDISTDVFGHTRQRIAIGQAKGSEDSSSRTGTCSFMLNNRNGQYSPVNPLGTWYGLLGLNTPLQLYKREVLASFTTTVANQWPATDGGEAWTTFGAGGALNASDYNSTGGMGTHLVPAANAYRSTYIATRSVKIVDILVDLKLDTTNITGAAVSWNVLLGGASSSFYYRAVVAVQTDESINLQFIDPTGTTAGTLTGVGISHVNTNTYRLRVQLEGRNCRMKIWLASGVEPYDWMGLFRGNFYINPGWYGLQSRRDTGNTNGSLTFSYDNFTARNPRFAGEVAEWPPKWDTSGNDRFVPVTASGVMRRIAAANTALDSPPRAHIPTMGTANGTTVVAYHPLEDGPSAVTGMPVVGLSPMIPVIGEKPLGQHFGKGTLDSWLKAVWAQFGDGSFGSGGGGLHTFVDMPNFVGTDGWRVDWTIRMSGSSDHSVTMNTTDTFFQFVFKISTKFVDYTLPTGGTGSIDFTNSGLFNGNTHVFTLGAHQSGGNVAWAVKVDGTTISSSTFAGTLKRLTGHGNGAPSTTPGSSAHAMGHATVFNKDFTAAAGAEASDAVAGFPGEYVAARMVRLCGIAGIPFAYDGRPTEGARMGVQSLTAVGSQLDDAAKADLGMLCDSRGMVGLRYRQFTDLHSRNPTVTLTYTSQQLSELHTTYDDQLVANDVEVTSDGATGSASLTSGPMSTAAPQLGGIGPYSRQYPVNALPIQLTDIAGMKVAVGTVNEVRFPQITVNLARPDLAALVDALLQVEAGDRIDINALPMDAGAQVKQLVAGYDELIDGFQHEITFNAAPYSPYQLAVLDAPQYRLTAGASFLNTSVSDSATSWSVKSTDGTIWTTTEVPVQIIIGGELVIVTAITGATSPQTFTVTRSANNVVKAHTADDSEQARIQVWEPWRLALWERT